MGSPPFRCCTCKRDDISCGPCQSLLAPLRQPLRDRCCRPSSAPALASRTTRAMHQLYLSETAAPHPSRAVPALVEKRPDGLTGRKPELAEIRHFPLSDFRPISVRWRPIFRSPVRFRGKSRRLRPPPRLPAARTIATALNCSSAATMPSMIPAARLRRLSRLLGRPRRKGLVKLNALARATCDGGNPCVRQKKERARRARGQVLGHVGQEGSIENGDQRG